MLHHSHRTLAWSRSTAEQGRTAVSMCRPRTACVPCAAFDVWEAAGAMSPGGAAAQNEGRHSDEQQAVASTKAKQRALRRKAQHLIFAGPAGTSAAPAATADHSSPARRLTPTSTVVAEAQSSNNILRFSLNKNRALVLDSSYRPINVVSWDRAVHLDWSERAEVVEYYDWPAVAVSGQGDHPLPAVLRVKTHVNLEDVASRVACSRRNIMIRDKFRCCYCNSRRDLTLDHLLPVSKGGRDTWENLVTACMSCNQKKGSHLLSQLGWKLKREPREPKPYEIGVCVGLQSTDLSRPPQQWKPYIQSYHERQKHNRQLARDAGISVFDSMDEEDGQEAVQALTQSEACAICA